MLKTPPTTCLCHSPTTMSSSFRMTVCWTRRKSEASSTVPAMPAVGRRRAMMKAARVRRASCRMICRGRTSPCAASVAWQAQVRNAALDEKDDLTHHRTSPSADSIAKTERRTLRDAGEGEEESTADAMKTVRVTQHQLEFLARQVGDGANGLGEVVRDWCNVRDERRLLRLGELDGKVSEAGERRNEMVSHLFNDLSQRSRCGIRANNLARIDAERRRVGDLPGVGGFLLVEET